MERQQLTECGKFLPATAWLTLHPLQLDRLTMPTELHQASCGFQATPVQQKCCNGSSVLWQVNGHFMADLDPLGLDRRPMPIELDPALYGFSDKDLDRE